MSARRLVAWFRKSARELPWRGNPRHPYHVVVSEFMLQQTQVDRVVPRFEAFIERFPSLAELAAADENLVVEMWSGLGYYRRARLLHRLAREVVASGGELPRTAAELRRLPGIGPYTAAAVAALAFGEASAVLDGNTLRVGARVLALSGDPRSAAGRRRVEAWIASLLGGPRPGEVNEALMELGATVCTPLAPACDRCPLAPDCAARAAGRPEDYPPPRNRRPSIDLRWVAVCAVAADGRWLLRRVDDGPILRGLWLPPFAEVRDDADPVEIAARLLPSVAGSEPCPGRPLRHHITHRRIEVVPVILKVETILEMTDGWRWADPAAPGVPTSSLLSKLVDAVAQSAER